MCPPSYLNLCFYIAPVMPAIIMVNSSSTAITILWTQYLDFNVTSFRINSTFIRVIDCPGAVGSSSVDVVSLENVVVTNKSFFTYDVEGLTPYSEYMVSLTARNDGGTSPGDTRFINTSMTGMC